MRANEFVTETPRTAAAKPEIVSVQDDGKTITIKVRGNDGAVRAISDSNPAVLQQHLNLKYGLRLPHSIARKFVGMPAAMAEDQADNPDSWESQAADAERDAETVRMAAQDAEAGGVAEAKRKKKSSRSMGGYFFPGYGYYGSGDSGEGGGDGGGESVNRGVAEGSLDERSTSQAQFRTMAAAAHNPKFAKKVGISPDVAREFHGADKKSNYKSLPRKAAEDASWGMAPESQGYKK